MTLNDIEYWEFRATEENKRWNDDQYYFTHSNIYWVYNKDNNYYYIRTNYYIERHLKNINIDLNVVIKANLHKNEFLKNFIRIL